MGKKNKRYTASPCPSLTPSPLPLPLPLLSLFSESFMGRDERPAMRKGVCGFHIFTTTKLHSRCIVPESKPHCMTNTHAYIYFFLFLKSVLTHSVPRLFRVIAPLCGCNGFSSLLRPFVMAILP